MSSPTTTPKRTSKKTTPKRTPLQERSPSQKNEAAGRLKRNSRPDFAEDLFATTPFPTKPQHVLLPSTIRKQRSKPNAENELPGLFFNTSQPEISRSNSGKQRRQNERKVRRAPNLQLKRSVSALRDMYEAQAESSRPSTAVSSRPSTTAPSPALRPTSARLRSMSSNEALSTRSAWEMLGLPKISAEDLSKLPVLPEHIQNIEFDQSFASRVRNQGATSSPNFKVLNESSPGLPSFYDLATSSDPLEESSAIDYQTAGTSSPNVIRLQHSSSMALTDFAPISLRFSQQESSPNFAQLHHSSSNMSVGQTPSTLGPNQGESSPNLIKLGTTSPRRSSSSTPSQASTISRKRKRSHMDRSTYAGRTPLFFGHNEARMRSSPPSQTVLTSSNTSLQYSEQRVLPSSPPEIESTGSQSQPTSSPVIRLHVGRFNSDRSSIVSAHTNLQSVLSSSPAPPVHRPIVRAPDVNQFDIMAMQKREVSGASTIEMRRTPLSPVPSVTNIEVQQLSVTDLDDYQTERRGSRISAFTEKLDDNLDADSIAPAQAYMVEHDLNSSQLNMISDADRHEAADELSALPRQHSSFAAVLGQARSASYLGSSSNSSVSRLDSLRTSMDERLHSMRSYNHARNDSLRSSYRPESSGSYRSVNVLPTWARKYYSGYYQDSFQYLYNSSHNLSVPVTHVQPPSRPVSNSASVPNSSSYETMSSGSIRQSWSRSFRSSIKSYIPISMVPTQKPRLNVRQSHLTAGVGPLVSNPVRPVSETIAQPPSAYQNRQTIRCVSMPISAADPRYHWNGVIEVPESTGEVQQLEDQQQSSNPRYSESSHSQIPQRTSRRKFMPPLHFKRLPTPQLHRDKRPHTGSSQSHGFGAPYNGHSRWQPTIGQTDHLGAPSWFKVDVRDSQVICFIAGFLFPPMWFAGAVLPLPSRPMNYTDLEKAVAGPTSYPPLPRDWEETDILARLRLEKHLRGLEELRWQNARWWRRMNRWMCCVGLVVLTVVVVLAVLGTRSDWA